MCSTPQDYIGWSHTYTHIHTHASIQEELLSRVADNNHVLNTSRLHWLVGFLEDMLFLVHGIIKVLYVFMYVCVCVCVYMITWAGGVPWRHVVPGPRNHKGKCLYVCVCICMHACIYACMYVCVYVRDYIGWWGSLKTFFWFYFYFME
jgi:hypothetical protein